MSESTKNEPNGFLGKIKSTLILKHIFNHLSKMKSLRIVKNIKKTQNRLHFNIKDYKLYSEKYTPIEIEIIPIKYTQGKFINLLEKYEEYYHIFIDSNKEEIKRNKLYEKESVSKIRIIIDYQIESFKKLFADCEIIESIKFKKFYRNNINDMSEMFYNCNKLKEINFSFYRTDNVTNMNSMFYGCSSLEKIDMSKFNTENVINMGWMFDRCILLKEINLSNFNTNNLKIISYMFCRCSSLNKIIFPCFNKDKEIDMRYLFYKCEKLKDVNIDNDVIIKATNINYLFSGCSNEFIKKIKSRYKNIKLEAFFDD